MTQTERIVYLQNEAESAARLAHAVYAALERGKTSDAHEFLAQLSTKGSYIEQLADNAIADLDQAATA